MNVKLNIKFDDPELKNQIVNFTLTNYLNPKYFVCNGFDSTQKRYFSKILNHSLEFTDQLKRSRINFFKSIGIDKFKEEPYFGIFIGLNLEGGFVQPHTDLCTKGFVHTRINFLLSKPDQGGNPLIEDQEIHIEEDCAWLNLASRWQHSSTPVMGNKPRIVISYGAFVSEEIIDSLNLV